MITLYIIPCTGWLKNVTLAFKSNYSRPMRYTTSPDTPFERADNFLSNECIHTRFPFQIALSEAANQKSSVFLCVQISSNGKMCFVVPVSHLRKQVLHVTARDISHQPPKGKTNSGTTWTAVASYPINGSFTSSCWTAGCLAIGVPTAWTNWTTPAYTSSYIPPAIPQAGSLTSEEPRLKSHKSSYGDSLRGRCAVKIQDIDNLKKRLRRCWAHFSQHRVAKDIQDFTKRLNRCIASHGGRFEHRFQWDEKMM